MFTKNSGNLIMEQIKDVENCLINFESFMRAATTADVSNDTLRALMKGVCEAGVRAGAEWMIVEQDSPTPGKTPLECIAESADWLKQNRYM